MAEVERLRAAGGPPAQRADGLVTASVEFAFRMHQFVGGFDEVCREEYTRMHALQEELLAAAAAKQRTAPQGSPTSSQS